MLLREGDCASEVAERGDEIADEVADKAEVGAAIVIGDRDWTPRVNGDESCEEVGIQEEDAGDASIEGGGVAGV